MFGTVLCIMADENEDTEDATSLITRKRGRTAKRLEDKLHRLMDSRTGKLAQMTARSNEVERLMDSDSPNVTDIMEKEMRAYKRLYEEFVELNSSVKLHVRHGS